ncbi:hypothetical protein BDZ45DRAFT_781240 [Acephala macrosclerotiorum]|nr:hypothetical protein BDZ45DRAFT_781240 [Acephala macrosclerotiorum]
MPQVQQIIKASGALEDESRPLAMQWNGTWFWACPAEAVEGIPADRLMRLVSAVPFGSLDQGAQSVAESVDTPRDTPAQTLDSVSSAPPSQPPTNDLSKGVGSVPHAKNWTKKETDFLFQLVEEMIARENRHLTKDDFHEIKKKMDEEFTGWVVEKGEQLASRDNEEECFAKSAWYCPQRSWNALNSHATRGHTNKARYEDICRRLIIRN